MFDQCYVAVYRSFDEARKAIQALDEEGFPEQQISLVTHDVAAEVPREEELQYGDDNVADIAKGAGAGGLLGALLSAPLLTIPGLGLALLAGPLAAGATGAIVGGFLGGLSGWGVHKDHIQAYEEKVKEGCLLVVASGNPAEIAIASRVLNDTDAEETHLHARTSDDAPEVDDRPAELG
jgi:uncharacterized membrane protein